MFYPRFPERELPKKCTIHYNTEKFKQRGTILNRNKDLFGRPVKINVVQSTVQDNPRGISCHRSGIGVSAPSFRDSYQPSFLEVKPGLL